MLLSFKKCTQLLEIVLLFLRYKTPFHIHILYATLRTEEGGGLNALADHRILTKLLFSRAKVFQGAALSVASIWLAGRTGQCGVGRTERLSSP